MTSSQISSIISYISVFFAPVLLPLIVLIAGDDFSRSHARRALISHLIPALMFLGLSFWVYLSDGVFMYSFLFWLLFSSIAFIQIVIMIYNVIWAVQVAKVVPQA
ncbi:hypothetical protein SAMN05421781_0380 [Marinococcus luteus]|uniref:DUF4870 domain-containing protein n=1 Tax=Marinococcus luteus TaxID=1122204 RepID=A0A1H2QM44_9BACI|nr:hypothetical protein [Marinococcus luteus]SDW08226.1 hypothetical protein SAMN05421781_0380 [Marinococcus luteus]